MGFYPVDWKKIWEMTLRLADQIVTSGFNPDAIVGILRGGYIISRIVADVLGTEELGVVEVKFYKGIGETAERPIITQPLMIDVRNKNVLIVDDVVDSGRTLEVVTEQVRLRGASQVRAAALFTKPRSIIKPDYFVEETTNWVIFPWELGEFLRETHALNSVDEALGKLRELGLNVDREFIETYVKASNYVRKAQQIRGV